MTNNTRSYLNNKVWYRLLKVVYIFTISIICLIIGYLIYEDTEYKENNLQEKNIIIDELIPDIQNIISEGRTPNMSTLKQYYPELINIKEKTIEDLVADMRNVIAEGREVEPVKLKALYPELFYKNTQEYIESKNNVLKQLSNQMAEGVLQGQTINIDKLKLAYPEISNAEDGILQELSDQIAEGVSQGQTINIDKLRAAYPEFYNQDFINNYSGVDTIIIQKEELINPNIKITLMLIGKFILIIGIAYLISELFNRVLYYIVLGSFNPKK